MFFTKFDTVKKGSMAILCGAIVTTLVQANEVEDSMLRLNTFIENQSSVILTKNAETVFIFFINTLGCNIDLPEKNEKPKNEVLLSLFKKFLSKGVNPNIMYSKEMKTTPLHHAAFLGLPEVVDLLLTHGADYLVEDSNGHRALWYADPATHAETIKTGDWITYTSVFLSIIPVVGGMLPLALYMNWQKHQRCYELLMKAENPLWQPSVSSRELENIKKSFHSDVKELLNLKS